ncbi:molybdopterin-dependent oxidoreductase [Thermodesulfobacteriota bacterium]
MEPNVEKIYNLLKLNRRNFIKLVIGGAAGIHLTPLPWKLMDDSAIWTQNWPWVPVPPVGEFSHETSVCQLCPGGCGIEVRKVEKRAVKIEGRTDYPVNPGGICPLGTGGLQLLYNETIRHTSPMKRIGPRGAAKYQPISWEEALTELTKRIKGLRRKGQPEAVAAIDGNPKRSSMALLIQRFMKTLGSPNYVGIPSVEDTYSLTNMLMQGNEGPMAYDLENADFIISFGCGLIEGWGSPGRVINAWGVWRSEPQKEKTKIVHIDSRASRTASKSDQWLAVIPGTEGALALGLAHVIIRNGLYNREFVDNYTFGFSGWRSDDGKEHMGFKQMVLEKYSPERVARITGLNLDVIVSLATVFAKSKAPIALAGKGKGELNGSVLEFMAIQSLNALVGNINRQGGVLVHEPLPLSSWPEAEKDDTARKGLKKSPIYRADSQKNPFALSQLHSLTEALAGGHRSPVDTLLIFAANPAYTVPDNTSFINALKKVPYIVTFSPYKDETSLMADLILPDHTYLEKVNDIVWPTGLQFPCFGLSKPVVEPLYETRNSGDVIIQMAKEMGGTVGSSFPWRKFEESIKARVKGLFEAGGGLTRYGSSAPLWEVMGEQGQAKPDYKSFPDMWKKIRSGGLWYRPRHNFKDWESIFKTPSGKFEFFSSKIEITVEKRLDRYSMKEALKQLGIRAKGDEAFMPHYEAPIPPADPEKYPLRMIPYSLINLSTGWLPNPHFLTKTLFDNQIRKNESFADIHPETAGDYNLKQGDRIILTSPKGHLKVRVNIFEGSMPGVVFLPLGFGHTAYDDYQKGRGENPYKIMDGGENPLSGQTEWWETRVQLQKV